MGDADDALLKTEMEDDRKTWYTSFQQLQKSPTSKYQKIKQNV